MTVWIALGTAIYAALVGTVDLFLRWRDRRKGLRITLYEGGLIQVGGASSAPMVFTDVANESDQGVTITSLEFIHRGRGLRRWSHPGWRLSVPIPAGTCRMPCRIEPGDKCSFWTEKDGLLDSFRDRGVEGDFDAKCSFKDATGRIWWSSGWTFS